MTRSVTFSERPDVAALLAQAEAETGLDDFGDGQFRGSLAAFAAFVNSQQQLGADSRRAAFGQMVRVLGWRLRLVEDRKRYPGIGDERIEAPLIVIGFPRSGTTLLHALLAADPGNRAPLNWRSPARRRHRRWPLPAIRGSARALATSSAGWPNTRGSSPSTRTSTPAGKPRWSANRC